MTAVDTPIEHADAVSQQVIVTTGAMVYSNVELVAADPDTITVRVTTKMGSDEYVLHRSRIRKITVLGQSFGGR